VVERFLQALTARDAEGLAALCATDVDWYIPGHEKLAPWLGRRTTRSQVAEYARLLFGSSRPVSATIHHVYVDGDAAVVTGEFVTAMTATGRLIESPFSAEFTVRTGRIVRYRLLEDSHALVVALT
jgi:uncharacterized protein